MGAVHIDAVDLTYVLRPGIHELRDIISVLEDQENEVAGQIMDTILSTPPLIFNS